MAISTWCKQQSKDGRGPATVAKYHRLLSRILNDAVQERLITENVAKFVKVSLPTTHKETYLTRGQVDELMRLSESPVVIRTLAYTGRRWGEFAGLHKGDVDFLRGVMTVSQTVTEVSGKYMIKPYPKGRRPIQVPVPQHVLDALAGHMAQTPPIVCGLEREDGKPHRCSGLIFHTDRGKPLSRWVWPRTHLLPHLSAAGCPPETTTHDLRHTYASWLIQDGVSLRVVQKLLGHKSIVTTERYSHLEADTGLDAVRKALDTTSDPTDGESEGQSFA
jgi:integrase